MFCCFDSLEFEYTFILFIKFSFFKMIYTNRYEPFSSDPPHLIWSIKKKTINVVKQHKLVL